MLYNISENHYVGLPVYNENKKNSILLESINRYVVLSEIDDYNRNNIKKCIYIKGKPLKINNSDFFNIILKAKDYFLNYIKDETDNTIEGIKYCKWCRDKLILIKENHMQYNLRVGAICWINLGYNVGNELRKMRPAILWRSSSTKEMWTVIPLTSKHKNDDYYFHYDLENQNLGTAKIENMINISLKRIKGPYYIKNRIATITKKDNDNILKIIKKYYAFATININEFNSEKVLT